MADDQFPGPGGDRLFYLPMLSKAKINKARLGLNVADKSQGKKGEKAA